MIDYKAIAKKSHASQDEFELWQLLQVLAQDPPKLILEIGVHTGQMLASLSEAFPKAGLIGVDNDFQHLTYSMFQKIEGDSHDPATFDSVANQCKAGVDFLFIDGDHNYAGVGLDYEMYSMLVRPGGIIAFHDIMRPAGLIEGVEVRKFWDELRLKTRGISRTMEIWGGNCRIDRAHPSDSPGTGVVFT